jgi:hypothetical protein
VNGVYAYVQEYQPDNPDLNQFLTSALQAELDKRGAKREPALHISRSGRRMLFFPVCQFVERRRQRLLFYGSKSQTTARYRVHKTMKGFGDPIHYSVFRCLLTAKGKVELVAALTEIIKTMTA